MKQQSLLELLGFQDPGGAAEGAAGREKPEAEPRPRPNSGPLKESPPPANPLEGVKVPKTATVVYAGMKFAVADLLPEGEEEVTLEQVRARLEEDYPEFAPDRTHMEYDREKDLVFAGIIPRKLGSDRLFAGPAGALNPDAPAICYVAAWDGLYEVRRTRVGRFWVKMERPTRDFPEWREGFEMFLPPVPGSLLAELVGFFRRMAVRGREAMAWVCWDEENGRYFVHVPRQRVTSVSCEPLEPAPGIPVVEVHSHGFGPACPSSLDEASNIATGFYVIVGRLDRLFPEVYASYVVRGQRREIHPGRIFADFAPEPPAEWLRRVED